MDVLVDESQFQQDLNREDELGRVIRAHLHIENLVKQLLALEFEKPAALERVKLDFSDRVTLLEAYGYGQMLTRPLSALGTLRNAFAHNLSSALTEDRMQSLYKSFDAAGKEIIQGSYQRTRLKSEAKVPRTLGKVPPAERFVFFAISIRAMLVIAHKERVAFASKGAAS